MNPFETLPFNTPFNAIPFEDIKIEHYLPAIKNAISKSKAEIDAICANTENPTFKNTIVALENAGQDLSIVSTAFYNLNSAETSEEMQKLAQEISPLMTEHSNDILLNASLFQRVKTVFDHTPTTTLDVEDTKLLEKSYKGFVRNGALLNETDQIALRELNNALSLTALKFGENVLKESNAFELFLTDEKELAGLPDSAKEAAALLAKEKGKEGWLITLDYPSYIPFITYADNRALREELFKAFSSKANKGNDYDNNDIVKKIALLRHQKATLLGYDSHAAYILEERMAKSADKVNSFLTELLDRSLPTAQEEHKTLQAYADKNEGPSPLQRWDAAYYSEKLKKATLNFDEEKLKPFFQLEKVTQGVFDVAQKLYGLVFKENTTLQKYHPEVTVYEVYDAHAKFVSLFYTDFFPRPGKRQGAWMTSFKGQHGESRPHVSIVCNFTKPTETTPSLLTFNEVTTLFHEFGHALHGMLAQGKYESLTGTNVSWDFVELPSQVLENWCYEKECLDLFATHYESGETIPEAYIDQIKQTQTFQSGMFSVRQLSFGLLDMAWHGADPSEITDIETFEKTIASKTKLYPEVEHTAMSPQFSHIFQGGYSAGYYSYKWAEVLDADAFEYFKEEGIFNEEVATKFKKWVLSKGSTLDPEVLYEKFRGKKASITPLLKRSGLSA